MLEGSSEKKRKKILDRVDTNSTRSHLQSQTFSELIQGGFAHAVESYKRKLNTEIQEKNIILPDKGH